ncbi:MAG: peptidyl-prolyl cis-trans isomerase [Candidatus Omnitrophica bacterium]|nr:peptidyl-prolyl cis-trans isomerase [Candidatus Omnitrophota bacterium]
MLKQLRHKKTAKRLWIALAIVIIPAFVFWGFSGALRSRQEQDGSLEFRDSLEAVKNLAIMQFGDNFSEIQRYLNLESQAYLRLLLLREAKARRIKASNKEVIEAIEDNPLFQRKGAFDNRIYSELLQYTFRTQPRIFEEQTRQSLMISRLYDQVTKDVKLNEQEISEEYRKANEEISIYYIAGLPADFAKEINPSEKELLSFFAKNSLQFKEPLSFNLNYVAADSEDKIRQVYARLGKTNDLDETAAQFKLAVKETGLFGQTDAIPGIGWSPEILMAVSKLKKENFTDPIGLDKSYYILKLKERKEPYIPPYPSIQDKVRDTFVQEESKRIAKGKTEDCLEKLRQAYQNNPKSADFNKFAKACGLKSESSGFFKFGSYIENIGSSDSFWKESAALKENETSGVIALPSGFYIIKVKQRVPVDEKRFAAEKEVFAQRLLQDRKQDYFNRFVEELKKKSTRLP